MSFLILKWASKYKLKVKVESDFLGEMMIQRSVIWDEVKVGRKWKNKVGLLLFLLNGELGWDNGRETKREVLRWSKVKMRWKKWVSYCPS